MTDVDVAEDLFQLLGGDLRADHGGAFERVGLLDGGNTLERALHEAVVDALLNERATGAGADFALIEGEHHEALDRLVKEIVVFVADVVEEDVGGFAAQLKGDGNQVLAGVLHDEATGCGFASEGDLGHPGAGGEGLAGFKAVAVDDVQHARRQQVTD